MNSQQIDKILKRRCRGKFLGVFSKDTLPTRLPSQRPLLLVCNTDKKSRPGKHWIAIYLDIDESGEYFDSFGRPPKKSFKHFLNKNCVRWNINSRQIQSASSYFCGQYCVFYCLYKSIRYSTNSILACFSSDTGLNDVLVHTFVCKMLNK